MLAVCSGVVCGMWYVVCGMWGVEDELRMAVVRVLLSKRKLRT
jgi:hypothetical protein